MTMPLPKEQQTAYQRWEMASFGDDRASAQLRMRADGRTADQRSEQEAAELEAARQQGIAKGYQEGIAKGYEDGIAKGYEDGLAKGYEEGLIKARAQAEEERQQIKQIAQQFGEEVANANELIAADVLLLAFDVAKAMLKTALPAKPELILPIVKEAVGYLPTVQQPALLVLHPVDAALVSGQMGAELTAAGWRIIENSQLERGGCRVETASNQIDATISTRWQRIADALAVDPSWMDA